MVRARSCHPGYIGLLAFVIPAFMIPIINNIVYIFGIVMVAVVAGYCPCHWHCESE